MEKRDFRISDIVRDDLQLSQPVFKTDENISELYREALNISYKYNQTEREKGKSDYISAAKLHATAVLHLLYQIVLSACMNAGHADFFMRRQAAISENDELRNALKFYSTHFPSPLLDEDKRKNEGIRREEDSRAFFIHQVMINNPALVEASRPFVYPENLQYPSGFSSLASLLSAYIKDESRNGKSLEDEDIFTLLTKPSRIYPNSLTDQIKYIIREWAYLLPKDLIELLQLSISYIKEEEKDRGIPGPPGPMPVTDYSDELYEYEAFSDDSNWMPRVVMIAKCTLV